MEAKVTLHLVAVFGLVLTKANLGTESMEEQATGVKEERTVLGRVPPVRDENGNVLGAMGEGRTKGN